MSDLPVLLVIEDGDDYIAFARLFLADRFSPVSAKSYQASLPFLSKTHAILLDLRFDLALQEDLLGDVSSIASRLFGGDHARASTYILENQGIFILAELRKAGCLAPALIINDLPAKRLENLQKLYGAVDAVPDFDAQAIRAAFEGLLET